MIVLERLAAEGITILSGVRIAEVRKTESGVAADIEEKGSKRTISGSHLLIAAGRTPNIAELNLEAAGIGYTKAGITVDRGLQNIEPTGVRDRRCGGRAAVHARGELPCGAGDQERAVSPAGQQLDPCHSLGHLYRP